MLGAFPEKPQDSVDQLTGLPTREPFDDELARQVHQYPGRFGILYADADDLKVTNDTYGHRAGDELLVNIASTIEDMVRRDAKEEDREPDYVSRDVFRLAAKGDEFAIILSGADTQEKVDAARDRIQDGMAKKGLRVSMGGRPHRPGESAKDLLHDVDQMMYNEKKARREAHKRELRASLPKHRALFFWGADKMMKMAKLEYKINQH